MSKEETTTDLRFAKLLIFFKKNKMIVGILILLLVLLLLVHGGKSSVQRITKKSTLLDQGQARSVSISGFTDAATGDDAAENLDALTQALHAVIKSNASLKANNVALNDKNTEILHNIKTEVEQNLDQELKRRGDTNQQHILQLQATLTHVNQQLNTLKKQRKSAPDAQNYAVGNMNTFDHTSDITPGNTINLAGHALMEVTDVSSSNKVIASNNTVLGDSNGSDSLLHPGQADQAEQNINDDENGIENSANTENQQEPKKSKPIPYYTIPNGATLADSVTMTSLIGRVPVDGVVKSPYPFKIIIGGKNLATNGLHIPGLSGAIIQGVTVGDMALRCVKGYVQTILISYYRSIYHHASCAYTSTFGRFASVNLSWRIK